MLSFLKEMLKFFAGLKTKTKFYIAIYKMTVSLFLTFCEKYEQNMFHFYSSLFNLGITINLLRQMFIIYFAITCNGIL